MATAQSDTGIETGYYDPDEDITYTEEVNESADDKDTGDSEGKGEETDEQDSGLSPDLRDEAEHVYGLKPETIAKFQTDDELQRFLDAAAELPGRSRQDEWTPPHEQQQPTDVPEEPDDFKIDLSGFEEDDPSRKAIERLVAERNSLKKDVSEIRQYIEGQQQAETKRMTDRLVSELYAGLEEFDPVLYGKSKAERKAGQEQLVREVMSEYQAIVSGQLQSGQDFYSLDLRAIAKRASQGTHFDKLVRRHQQRDAANGRRRTERGTFARQTNTPGRPEPEEHSKLGNLTQNRDLLAKVDEIRARGE